MPTTRERIWLTMPRDPRDAAIVRAIMEDLAELRGQTRSDALTGYVTEAFIPREQPARAQGEALYAGDTDLLGSAAALLGLNYTDGSGGVRCPGYRDAVEFAFDLTACKGCMLDNTHAHMELVRGYLGGTLDALEAAAADQVGTLEGFDLERQAAYGRMLLEQLDPERQPTALAAPYLKFALDAFDVVGGLDRTCRWLSLMLGVAADTGRELERAHGWRVPPDTARQRREWLDLLASHADDWAALH